MEAEASSAPVRSAASGPAAYHCWFVPLARVTAAERQLPAPGRVAFPEFSPLHSPFRRLPFPTQELFLPAKKSQSQRKRRRVTADGHLWSPDHRLPARDPVG